MNPEDVEEGLTQGFALPSRESENRVETSQPDLPPEEEVAAGKTIGLFANIELNLPTPAETQAPESGPLTVGQPLGPAMATTMGGLDASPQPDAADPADTVAFEASGVRETAPSATAPRSRFTTLRRHARGGLGE